MSDQTYKSRRIPVITENRLDSEPSEPSVTKAADDRFAQAFIKGKEPVHTMTLRLPMHLYKKIREDAFMSGQKISQIIVGVLKKQILNDKPPDE